MPKFRAIVEGQKFLFMLDDEAQHLDFQRTICLEAECVQTARQQALRHVMAELSSHELVLKEHIDAANVNLGHIEQIDSGERVCHEQDFIWYFPDDAVFEHKLRSQQPPLNS